MTDQQQVNALLNIENTLPGEFSLFMDIVRDVYYEDERTPERPANFDGGAEVFGKAADDAEDDLPRPVERLRIPRNYRK